MKIKVAATQLYQRLFLLPGVQSKVENSRLIVFKYHIFIKVSCQKIKAPMLVIKIVFALVFECISHYSCLLATAIG